MPLSLSCDRCNLPFVPADGNYTENATIAMRRVSDAAPGGLFSQFACEVCEAMDEKVAAFAFPYGPLALRVLTAGQLAAARVAVASMNSLFAAPPPVVTTEAPPQTTTQAPGAGTGA